MITYSSAVGRQRQCLPGTLPVINSNYMLMYPVSEGTAGLVNMQSFMKHVYNST